VFQPSILREGYLMLQHSWRGVKWSWGNHVTASTRSRRQGLPDQRGIEHHRTNPQTTAGRNAAP
jgi:hypothetical protein